MKVKVVFISIDPMRDNPTHLKAYLRGGISRRTCYFLFIDIFFFFSLFCSFQASTEYYKLAHNCHLHLNIFAEFDPRIMGLTGSVDAIRQVAREYRVFFRKVDEDSGDYLIESSNNM